MSRAALDTTEADRSDRSGYDYIDHEAVRECYQTAMLERDFDQLCGLVAVSGADIHWRDYAGNTALHLYVDSLTSEPFDDLILPGLNRLLGLGARLLPDEGRHATPLHLQAYTDFPCAQITDVIDRLLAHATAEEVNAYDKYGKTALLEAIEQGHAVRAVQIIRSGKADVNLPVRERIGMSDCLPRDCTPLIAATVRNLPAVVDALIDAGADPYLQCVLRFDFIQFDPVGKPLWEKVPPEQRIELPGGNPLHVAALYGNKPLFIQLVKRLGKKALFERDDNDRTPLVKACCGLQDGDSRFIPPSRLTLIQWLFNKAALNYELGEYALTDAEYNRLVNPISRGRTLLGCLQYPGRHTEMDAIMSSVLACPSYNINQVCGLFGGSLVHNTVEAGDSELFEQLVDRGDVDFARQAAGGYSVLRKAVMSEEDPDEVDQVVAMLASLQHSVVGLNPNCYGETTEAMRLKSSLQEIFSEENHFGESLQFEDPVTLDTLYDVYRTGQSVHVKASINVTPIDTFYCDIPDAIADKEKLTTILRLLALDAANGEEWMYKVNIPTDIPEFLALSHEFDAHKDDRPVDEDVLGDYQRHEFDITYQGHVIHVRYNEGDAKRQRFDATLTYEDMLQLFNDDAQYDYKSNPALREGLFPTSHTPIIFELCAAIDAGRLPLSRLENFLLFDGIDLDLPNRSMQRLEDVVSPAIKAKLDAYKEHHTAARSSRRTRGGAGAASAVGAATPAITVRDDDPNTWDFSGDVPTFNAGTLYARLEHLDKTNALWHFVVTFMRALSVNADDARTRTPVRMATDSRRLDSFARLLEADTTCAAIAFADNRFIVTSNFGRVKWADADRVSTHTTLVGLTDQLATYCQRVANNTLGDEKAAAFREILLACLTPKLTQESHLNDTQLEALANMVAAVQTHYRQSMHLTLEETGRVADEAAMSTALHCDAYRGSFPDFSAVFACVVRYFLDLAKITADLSPDADSAFSPAMQTALRDKRFEVIGGPLDVAHTEARLAAHLSSLASASSTPIYIGISKLCCAHCNVLIENFSHFGHDVAHVPFTYTRGGAGICWEWVFPDALLKNGAHLLTFFGGAESHLGKTFRALSDEERLVALGVVQSIKLLKTKSLKRLGLYEHATYGRDAMNAMAPASTSAPPTMASPSAAPAAVLFPSVPAGGAGAGSPVPGDVEAKVEMVAASAVGPT